MELTNRHVQVTTPSAAAAPAPAYVPTTDTDYTPHPTSTPKNPNFNEKNVQTLILEIKIDMTDETTNDALEGPGVRFLLYEVVKLLIACICEYGYTIMLGALHQLQINAYFRWFVEDCLLPALAIEAVVACLFGRIIFYHLLSAVVDFPVGFMQGYLTVYTVVFVHVLKINDSHRMSLQKILVGALAIGSDLASIFGRILFYHLLSRVMHLIFGSIFICWFVTIVLSLCQL